MLHHLIRQIKSRIAFIPHFKPEEWFLKGLKKKADNTWEVKLSRSTSSGVSEVLSTSAPVAAEMRELSEKMFSSLPIQQIDFEGEKIKAISFENS